MARTARRAYANIATYLRETGITQAELATILGRSQAFVSKLVNGLSQPSLGEALRISRKIGIPVETLVSRGSNMPVGK